MIVQGGDGIQFFVVAVLLFFVYVPREMNTINCAYNNSIRVDEGRSCQLRLLNGEPDFKRNQSRALFWGGLSHFDFPDCGQAVVACVVPSPLYFYRPDGSAFPTARRFSSSFATN